MLNDPICYSVNSTAMGDVLAAVPVVKYAIDIYHKEADYRVVASKHFREFFWFVPDSKFLVMEDDTWKFDKPYAVKRLNDVGGSKGMICRLVPSKMSLSHYASIGLMGRILNTAHYCYFPTPDADTSRFNLDFSKCVILVASYRDVNRSIPDAEILKIAEHVHKRGLVPVYVGKTDSGAWKERNPVSPAKAPDYAIDLRNKTTILELASIIRKSVAVIGCDSGVIHLAGTTATPIIAAYTNVDWRHRIPTRREGRMHVVEPDPSCRYCSSIWEKPTYDFLNCYYGHNNCVKSLTAEKFINGLESILEDISGRPSFSQVWEKIKPCLIGENKSKNLYYELVRCEKIEGDMAEIGVYKGSTSKLMKLVFPEKRLHCYDTFCGVVNADSGINTHKVGDFAVPLENVKAYVGEDGVSYHVGVFPETFLQQETKPRFSFVHVDTDTYYGTKAALEHIFPILNAGGTLLFDDYKWPRCPGVEKAITEWLQTHSHECEAREYSLQCAITKK